MVTELGNKSIDLHVCLFCFSELLIKLSSLIDVKNTHITLVQGISYGKQGNNDVRRIELFLKAIDAVTLKPRQNELNATF